MASSAVRTKLPIPVLLLTVVALAVVGLLLASAAVGFFLGIVRLVIVLAGFVAIGFVGLFLWRRGEINR
ncbi:MAG: hypothetical protein OEV40_07970 [Acidimicrobiia bacterium]|nr:hypothetical protein [Acidimicrobiia bacterium]